MTPSRPTVLLIGLLVASTADAADDASLRDDARRAILRAVAYYHDDVAVHGGYVYFHSLDLRDRWGEGRASDDQIWVQPPGTPTVGMAFLEAWKATGDPSCLAAAREAAEALAYGQLRNGGWTNSIDLSGRRRGFRFSGGKRRREATSSLDDGQTQSALQLVMRVDEALGFEDETIHESAVLGLDSLLAAQFANGGFPQGWTGPVSKQPVLAAKYPDHDWRTEGRIKNYWDMYTINDNVCGYVAGTLIDAHRIYGDERYRDALRRLGDFLILAQMPEPQPGWAQQYDYEMQPIWARRFEPAAIAGDETQETLATLMKIADVTEDPKYLAPVPAALAWLKRSVLPDGRIARYYELRTNRPLYMSRRGRTYTLTYDDTRLPAHYGWKWDSRIDELEAEYDRRKRGRRPRDAQPVDEAEVRRVVDGLDDRGRWISISDGSRLVGQAKIPVGEKYLSSEVFSDNVTLLARYLEETDE